MGIQFLSITKKRMIKKIPQIIFKFKWLSYLLLIPVFAIGYKTNNSLINSFGCFDDCHVFSTAYFMTQGKTIYSEIFFNHNPFMPYLSYVIQLTTDPRSVYELLLRHRQAIFFISIIFNLLLLIRFRYRALGFILIFELTKFYTFGNRFLPEAIIVYPLVFLFGVGWEKLRSHRVNRLDLVIAAITTWFIIFMREPYVPLALFLYGYLLWKPNKKWQLISLGIFITISLVTLFTLPLKDFYFNVITFNLLETVGKEVSGNTVFGLDFLKIIFYPFFILFPFGDSGYYRQLLIFESIFFVILLIFNFKLISKKLLLFMFFVLALSNIRFTDPGVAFYAAYHMNVWYALFVFSLILLMSNIKEKQKLLTAITVFIGIVVFAVSKDAIIWQKVDQHEQLLTNYGQQMLYVQIIEKLSFPADTLFLDGWDELIYSQVKLPSSYKYSHFTSQMPNIKLYREARSIMFQENPPTFYYGTCREDVGQKLPRNVRGQYIQVFHDGKPTCLYVLKTKYEKINVAYPEITFDDEKN